MKIITSSEKETKQLASAITEFIDEGTTIVLIGDLGAGKTTFVKGMAQTLNIKKTIKSPTFTLMNTYKIKHYGLKRFCHIDAYRINEESLKGIGALDFLQDNNTLSVIEWGNKVKKLIPKNSWFITIKHKTENKREFTIKLPK
ncbi:MAG: tRNA (adenosine(37)-N6)-threonylcarbamoyltransferase complex ATPase subunit type 1 TsaE [Planctomycetes bacterium]|jgi:tRNA threonylcarbamoyladenosine biosynthesis protein TsaE|nr:tRNA (adenosine(37)-N6)-threonylcarbamoyltransferase complex ATPase subunit type 1 TsaE [Planctomycetota bacterium]